MSTTSLTHQRIIFKKDYVLSLAEKEWANLTQAIIAHTTIQENIESPEELANEVTNQLVELAWENGALNMDLKGDTTDEMNAHAIAINEAYSAFNARVKNKLGIHLHIADFDDEIYSFDTANDDRNAEHLTGLQFVALAKDVFMPKPQFASLLEDGTAVNSLFRTIC